MILSDFPDLTKPQVEESETALYTGNILTQAFLCTPEALEELAIGHLYCTGAVTSREQVLRLQISEETGEEGTRYEIRVLLNEGEHRSLPSLPTFQHPRLSLLQSLADRIKNMADKYRGHGGVHCAALSDGQDVVALYEDVGRHNAFDKAIGASVMKGINPSGLIYFSSGRINSEIAEKAAVCRLPLLVSRSIATTRACRILEKTGACVIGRIESATPIMYTAPARGDE